MPRAKAQPINSSACMGRGGEMMMMLMLRRRREGGGAEGREGAYHSQSGTGRGGNGGGSGSGKNERRARMAKAKSNRPERAELESSKCISLLLPYTCSTDKRRGTDNANNTTKLRRRMESQDREIGRKRTGEEKDGCDEGGGKVYGERGRGRAAKVVTAA